MCCFEFAVLTVAVAAAHLLLSNCYLTKYNINNSMLDLERYDVPDDLGSRPKLDPADAILLQVLCVCALVGYLGFYVRGLEGLC